ncbi:uncharacterized protein LOC131891484 isoform X1 [Tigriopus californicus]|uniref:uncharacterized protein LOC131891484 isoform X1 n=1 Tax=Tigriopus californicus TaxID=6832 RepID=UPI0027DAA4E1|nr:uncharacterized protein LOC131891484 isoform X1 [Tigriopus californicus]
MIRTFFCLELCLICSSSVLGRGPDVTPKRSFNFPLEEQNQPEEVISRFKRQANDYYYPDADDEEGSNRVNFNSAKGNSQAINSGRGDANSIANVVSNQNNHPRRYFGGHNPFSGFGRGFNGFNANTAEGNSQAINHGYGDANSAANVVANQFGRNRYANRGALREDGDGDEGQIGGRNFNSAIGNSQAINNGYGDANSIANVGSNQNNFGYPRRRPYPGGRGSGGSRGPRGGGYIPPTTRIGTIGGGRGGGGAAFIDKRGTLGAFGGGGGGGNGRGGGSRGGSWGVGGGGGATLIGAGGIGAAGDGGAYGRGRGWVAGGRGGSPGFAGRGGGRASSGGRRVPTLTRGGGGAAMAGQGGVAAIGGGGGGEGNNKLELDWPFGPVFNSNSAIGNSQAINHGIGHANSATNVVANSNRLLETGEDEYGSDYSESSGLAIVTDENGGDRGAIAFRSGYPGQSPLDYQYYAK